MAFSCSEWAPFAPVLREQLVRFLRPGAARLIDRKWRLAGFPDVEQGLHDLPAILDIVGALEQRRVAVHGIIDQRLVSSARLHLEEILVREPHLHGLELHMWPRHFGAELPQDALVR